MPSPLLDLFTGRFGAKRAVQTITPQRTLSDVILPPVTRRALDEALSQVRSHALIFRTWGLGERHSTGLGLVFNFAGPPGTGKTICAEAIANALGMQLLVVRYAELESMWAGETPKNVSGVFRLAAEQRAVLFFDEADAIAARRSVGVQQAYQREANTVVNVLLRELEQFNGVVIFATNLAANFDPAFERRIRTHVLFEMPGVEERAQIWRVQFHPQKTPLADDVDFPALADRFAVSGGDIKNAVLKAATAAAAEPGPDESKRIHQRHLERAMIEVVGAKSTMQQSLFSPEVGGAPNGMVEAFQAVERRWRVPAVVGIGLGAAALLTALVALGLTLAR
jgi:SpoVK/Ycf46/Vps4 family AAA+-type ATPase